MEAGFFPAAFGQSPDPMLPKRPAGNLGPRMIIRYVVPGGDNQTFHVTQDVYPYAKGGTVTYMKPNQPIFGMGTVGGWFRAWDMKRTLVAQGLPAREPGSCPAQVSHCWPGLGSRARSSSPARRRSSGAARASFSFRGGAGSDGRLRHVA